MNEKPGETPNPLNANPVDTPEPAPVAPTPAPAAPEPVPEAPKPAPEAPADPMARPMEKAPEATATPAPKKKKTGLVIGIIVAALVIIGGIVAAILLLNMNRGDAVTKAMSKIMGGNAPENVKIDGTFDVVPSDESSIISNIKINLNSDATTNSLINSSEAQITASLKDLGDVSVNFSEVYAENGGDLYLKVDGATAAIDDYVRLMSNKSTGTVEETDEAAIVEETETESKEVVVSGESEAIDVDLTETISALSGVAEMIDGQWLRISADEMGSMTGEEAEDNQTKCVTDLVSNIKNYNNSIAEMYTNNPFISSTTEGVTLASKSGSPVYKVVIDQEKLSGFINALQNSDLATNFSSCISGEDATVDINELTNKLGNLPTLYVEVDDDYNFTRLYFDANPNNDVALTTDLEFSYPATINVAEPAEYKDLSAIMENLFSTMYALPVENTTNAVVAE